MMKNKQLDICFRLFIVVLSSTMYSLSIIWFLEPARLISIGLTGLGQILNRVFENINIEIPIGVFVLICNIPICIFGIKTVSLRFVIFTMISVLVQSFWLLGWDWLKVDFGISPDDKLFLALIGGLLGGCATGLALKFGTSTGGIDIIAQAFALRKNMSIGIFSTIINIILAVIAGGLLEHAWNITLYTFIFIIVSNLVVDKIHTAYNYVRIDIISDIPDEVAHNLVVGINRGCTIMDARGGYTNTPKSDVFMIISSYELHHAQEIIQETDPKAFMMVSPIKRIFGKFFRRTII